MNGPGPASLRPTLLLMSGRFVGFVVTFVIPVVLVRAFDQAEFGTYKQIFLLYTTIYGLAQLGMAESLFYFLPRSPERGGFYATNATLILSGSGLAAWAVLVATRSKLSGLLSNDGLSRYLGQLGILVALMLASSALEIVLTSRGRYGWASLSYGLSDVARAAASIIPVLLLRGLQGLLLGGIAFAGLRLAAMLLYLRKEYGRGLRPDGTAFREQIAYALPFQASVILGILESSFHQYAVSRSFDAATFAIYSVGCLQIPLVDLVAGSAANAMMVRMGEEMREGRPGAVLRAWHDTTRRLALVFFPMAALLIVSAPQLIPVVFTRSYLASVPIFSVWTATIVFTVFQVDAVLRTLAGTRFLMGLYFAKLVFIALLIGPFMAAFHLVGAVLVTALALALAKAACLLRIARLLEVGPAQLLPWRSLGRTAGGALLAAIAAALLKSVVHLPALPLLIVVGLVFVAIFAGSWFLWEAVADRATGSAEVSGAAGVEPG